MKRFIKICLLILGGLSIALFILLRFGSQETESNQERNRKWIDNWSDPGDSIRMIAFMKLESQFSDVNEIRLTGINSLIEDSLYNGINAPMRMIYFTYYRADDQTHKYFAKIMTFNGLGYVRRINELTDTSIDYNLMKRKIQAEFDTAMNDVRSEIRKLPDSVQREIYDTITSILK